MKTIRVLTATVLSLMLVFTMMPLSGFDAVHGASAAADGGPVAVDTTGAAKATAKAAFGLGDSAVTTSGDTMTITLQEDIVLNAPVRFVKGTAGKKVVLNLNGHTITGKAGVTGTDYDAAEGGNAIEIVPSDFDVEIKGGGSVVGGKGALHVSIENIKYGAAGGTAVCFVAPDSGSPWYPMNEGNALEHGLKITGGAQITGGAGGDVSGDDWLHNIPQRLGTVGDNYQFSLSAGKGGAGIGQTNAGIEYRATSLAYARIEVTSGTVQGGSGGTVDLGTDNTPFMTHYGLMNNSTIGTYMQGLSYQDSTYDEYLANEILFLPGDGGYGIVIGAGRKYVSVDNGANIIGGACGVMDCGKSKWINNIVNYDNQAPTAGDGIGVYGDIGYKNVEADLTNENKASKVKTSADMGIYIAGTVKGGTPPTATAKGENAGKAGDGIVLNGEDSYAMYKDSDNEDQPITFPQGEDAEKWGIVEVASGGQVFGGNGAVAQNGSSSGGGTGIHETYSKSNDGRAGESKIGTDYYLINGNVKGGNGGDSLNNTGTSGGNGFSFGNSRKDARIYGAGSATGGDGGSCISREGYFNLAEPAEGIRFYKEEYNNNYSYITENDGAVSQERQIDNGDLSVTASMSSFNDYPSTSTQLSCTVNKPDGYTGNVYITWFTEIKLQTNPSNVCVIEQPGNDNTSFNLLSNEQYKYLAYKTYPNIPTSDSMSYNIDSIATVDRITYTIKNKNSKADIYCTVQLEDGRWAKSNVMTISSNDRNESSGWNGSSSSGGPDDEAAATDVENLIRTLPWTNAISLDDEPDIVAARNAYELLSNTQKSMVDPALYQELLNAEAKIAELKAAQGGDPGHGGGVDPGQGGQQVDPPAQIYPPGTSISKLKKAKKGFTVKWRKQTAKVSGVNISGYQIQYSLKKNFKSKTKTITINGYSKASKKIGKLKKKKTYYVKIRTFVKANGQTYYSGWSGVKKVKTK